MLKLTDVIGEAASANIERLGGLVLLKAIENMHILSDCVKDEKCFPSRISWNEHTSFELLVYLHGIDGRLYHL